MKINQLKAGAALSYISMGLGYLVSIIYTPLMLRLLGQSEFGLYNLVSSVVAYLGVLNFGFGSAYMRYYSRYKVKGNQEKIATLNGMFLIIFSVLGLISVIAGTILTINTEIIFGSALTTSELSTAKILMMILVINLSISFPSIVFTSHIAANEKFVFQKLVEMIRTVANPFVVLPLLILGYGSVGMVLATTLLNITIEIINVVYCFNKLKMKFSFRNFDFILMREMTVFSSFIFMYMIIDQINWNVDKFILGRYKGTDEVAIYSLGAQLNSYLISLSTVISSVFIPRVNNIVAKNTGKNELTNLFIKIGRIQYILVTLVISGFVIFGQAFINLWAGVTYYDSYKVAVVLMIPMLIVLTQSIGIEIRKAVNKHQVPAIFMFIVALLNVIISIPLSKRYGAVGSALGTSLAVIVNQIFINIYYQMAVGLNIKFFWKEIFNISKGIAIPFVVGSFLIYYRNNFSDLNFLLIAVPYSIIYLVSIYLIGFNDFEKKLFFNDKIKKMFKFSR